MSTFKFTRLYGHGDPQMDLWFNGDLHILEPGVDFPQKVTSFRSVLWREAEKRERKIRTRMWQGRLHIQAMDLWGYPITPTPEPGPPAPELPSLQPPPDPE